MELSPAATERLAHPRFGGRLGRIDAAAAGLELVSTCHGRDGEPDHVELDALVDAGGIIRDLRYRAAATGTDRLVYESLAELCRGRELTTVAGLRVAEVQADVRARFAMPDFVALGQRGDDFPVLEKLARARHPLAAGGTDGATAWDGLGFFEKVRRVEEAFDRHIRPMLASDGGGIDLVDLQGRELVVQYSGACGACSAAMGGTLYFVEETLAEQLGVELKVTVQGSSPAAPAGG